MKSAGPETWGLNSRPGQRGAQSGGGGLVWGWGYRLWWTGACWGGQAGRGSCEIPWPSAGGAQFPESPSRGAGGGWGKAAGVIGGSVPVRPAGLPLATDRPGQLAVPIPGLGSSDHSPDPSLDLCLALPQTCQWRGRAEEAGEPRVCAEPCVLGRSGRPCTCSST